MLASALQEDCKSLLRCKSGVAAIEFSFVFPIFLYMMAAIFEILFYFYTSYLITQSSSFLQRDIKTGYAAISEGCGGDIECVQEIICNNISSIVKCEDRYAMGAESFNSINDLNQATALAVSCSNSPGYDLLNNRFNVGAPGDYVLAWICYEYKPVIPGIGYFLKRSMNGSVLIKRNLIAKVEPYAV